EGGGRRTPHPDRDRTLRPGGDAGPIDAVMLAPMLDDRLRPETAEEGYLLLVTPGPVVEGRAQRLGLDRVPADSDAETAPPAAQQPAWPQARSGVAEEPEHRSSGLSRRGRPGGRGARTARGTRVRGCRDRASSPAR